MENLLLALAVILALNLAFGVRIALSEVRSRRKQRREVGVLESMWADDRPTADRQRRPRFAGRTTAAAAAALVLSGVAVASTSSTREAVISTVGGVVDRLIDASTVDAAPADASIGATAASASPSGVSGAQRDVVTHEPNGAGVGTDTRPTSSAAPSMIA